MPNEPGEFILGLKLGVALGLIMWALVYLSLWLVG